MQSETLPQRTVVLLGAGHTHAHILRMWAQQPIHDTELICISSSPIATYSGMLPGVLAGQYAPEQMQLDLVRLCNAVGATLLLDEVTGMEVQTRKLYFADRPALHFSALSIGIGSVPAVDSAELSSDRLVKIKPMPTFLDRLRVLIEQCLVERAGRPVRIAVVGGGAGGLEVAFCLPNYVQRVTRQMHLQSKENPWNPDANQATVHHEPCTIAIVHGSGDLPAGFSLKTQDRVRHELTRRGIVVHAGSRVQKVVDTTICLENGTMLEADVIIWATHATPPPLLSKLVLPKDEHGFLRVNDNLQSTSATNVFAVGDSASYASRPLAKCGVYAVRQGPVLWENLQRLIHGKPLQPFQPQKDFLRLLNLGDGRAIGEYANWSFEGRWVWRWKDRIDRRFMEMFDVNHMSRMSMRSTSTAEVDSTAAMRCVGCGGKIGGSLLANVMAELEIPHRDEVVVGLDTPDDAAVLRFTPQKLVTATTDFFTSPVRDHYLAGRITALHALSDAWAMGAEPVAALANVTLPHGSTAGQYRVLLELMSGALRELKNAGATLVGGHTVEGAQVGLGLTILAQQDADRMMLKRDVELGDQLVLTKPLGVGTLLRAAAMSKCHADWWQSLVHSMLTSNGTAASIAFRHGVRAMTDITGFGLAGHLSEMLKSGNCGAKLDLGQIPVLPGAQALWDPPSRLFSTMDLENRRLVLGCIRLNGRATKFATQTPDEWESEIMQLPAVLFDPQTSGGLLIAVPKDRVSALLADLHRHEETAQAARIGEVQPGPWAIDLMGM